MRFFILLLVLILMLKILWSQRSRSRRRRRRITRFTKRHSAETPTLLVSWRSFFVIYSHLICRPESDHTLTLFTRLLDLPETVFSHYYPRPNLKQNYHDIFSLLFDGERRLLAANFTLLSLPMRRRREAGMSEMGRI